MTGPCEAYRRFAEANDQRDSVPTVQYTEVKQRIRIFVDSQFVSGSRTLFERGRS